MENIYQQFNKKQKQQQQKTKHNVDINKGQE